MTTHKSKSPKSSLMSKIRSKTHHKNTTTSKKKVSPSTKKRLMSKIKRKTTKRKSPKRDPFEMSEKEYWGSK